MNTVGKCLLGGGAVAGTVALAKNQKVRKAAALGTIATGTVAGVYLTKNPSTIKGIKNRIFKPLVEYAKKNGIKTTAQKFFKGLKDNYKNIFKKLRTTAKDEFKDIAGKFKDKSVKEVFRKGISKLKALPGPAKAIAAVGTLLFARTLLHRNKKS